MLEASVCLKSKHIVIMALLRHWIINIGLIALGADYGRTSAKNPNSDMGIEAEWVQ
jgi:hypothetical protein